MNFSVPPSESGHGFKSLNSSPISSLIDDLFANDHVFQSFPEFVIFIVYLILMAVGFLSNFFIIILFITKNFLGEPQSLLLINLAFSDTIYCLIFSPFNLHNILRKSWPFSHLLCKIVPSFQGILIFVSSGTITMISIQRTAIITRSFATEHTNILNHESLLVINVWIFALLLASPIFIFQRVSIVGIPSLISITLCEEDWPAHFRAYYTLGVLFVQWILPLTTMIVCHFKVDNFLHQNSKLRVRLLCLNEIEFQSSTHPLTNSELVSQCLARRDINERLKRNATVTRTLLRNTVLYGLVWLPLNSINLYFDFYPDTSLDTNSIYTLLAISKIIAICSPTCNAYLYYWSNTNVRKVVKNFNSAIPKSKDVSERRTPSNV